MSRELRETCLAAAQAGARVLRERYDRPRHIELKGRIDLVTDADRAAEEAVLAELRVRAPGVPVLAEESGAHPGAAGAQGSEARFIVDPLDGTTNYAHGLPLFCCTVGAEIAGEPVAGCTIDPLRDEAFLAAQGHGAELRRDGWARPLHVSAAAELVNALVCTGFPYGQREQLPQMLDAFGRFTALSRGTRRLGSAALDLAYVAAGRLDGFWETGLKPWDVVAGVVLVREALGVVTRFDGAPHRLSGGQILAAAPGLHAAMLQLLAGQ